MWKLLFQANHLLISDSSGSACIINYPIKNLQILDMFGTGENAASWNGTNSWYDNNLGEVITPCVMSKRVHPSVLDLTF